MPRPARFRTRRRRIRRMDLVWTFMVAAIMVVFALLQDRLLPPPPVSEVREPFGLCGERRQAACVIDGDTVVIGRRRVRLTGYDAPEKDGACEAEREAAAAATRALHAWLARGPFQWTGGSEPPRDRYGRELREARRGDDRLADHMVEAGLGESDGWGGQRDWCG